MEKIPSHDITPPTVGHHTPGDTTTQEMYAKRRHIYVREIKGLFQKVRRSANWALMMGFFLLPFGCHWYQKIRLRKGWRS